MAIFLLPWRFNTTEIPADAKERGSGGAMLMDMIKQGRGAGVLRDRGAITSEGKGDCIVEGTNLDVMKMTARYQPHVFFETRPVADSRGSNRARRTSGNQTRIGKAGLAGRRPFPATSAGQGASDQARCAASQAMIAFLRVAPHRYWWILPVLAITRWQGIK